MHRAKSPNDGCKEEVRSRAARRRRVMHRAVRSVVERLEDRTLLAYSLTLSLNPTIGVTSSTVSSSTTFTATNTGANLSWSDIAKELFAGHNVVVTTGAAGVEAGNITDQLVGGITINNGAGTSLAFQGGSGAKLVGNVSLGTVDLSGGNSSITVAAAGNVSVHDLEQQFGQLGSASLTSAKGAISGGTVKAINLSLSSATGIGSSGTPLSAQASNLVAMTGTGGIFISNTGNMAIGFSGEPFAGVRVTGASGDISLTNAGSITANRLNDVVKGPDNISVKAIGAASDVLAGGNNGLFSPSGPGTIASTGAGSTVSVIAGRDVLVGDAAAGLSGVGNVESAGTIVLTAGRNINVDVNSFVDAHGTGTLTATAGGNISLLQTVIGGARVTSEGGAVSLIAGSGGTFNVNANGGGVFSTQSGGNGAITISADDIAVPSGTIGAGTGTVTLQPTSSSRVIDLGTKSVGNLGLTDAELAHVTAGTLLIGNTSDTGNIEITAPLTAPFGYASLSLRTGGAIVDHNATEPDVQVTNLALRAGGGISLDTAVSNLAFSNIAGAVSIRNTGGVTVTGIDGLTSSTNTGTTTTLSTSSPITFAVNTSSAGSLTATTSETASETTTPLPPPDDNVAVNPGVTVQSTGGDVTLRAGDAIVINSAAQVLAPAGNIDLRSGSGDNDNDASMTLNGTVAANAVSGTVALNATNGSVAESTTGTITAAGLLFLNFTAAGGLFSLDASTTNSVETIAATTQAAISYRNAGAVAVGTVTSPNESVTTFGILSNNRDVTLSTSAGDITLSQAINAGSGGTLRLEAAGAISQTAAGQITASNFGAKAGGNISLLTASPANAVTGIVACNAPAGTVGFQDGAALTVGTVTASGAFSAAVSGITATGVVTLCSAGALTIAQPIIAGANTVRLQSAGSTVQTASGTIAAANLGVVAAGSVGLAVAGAPNNISGIFAANTSGGPAGSFVQLLNAGPLLTVETVTASTCFAGASGVQTNAGNFDLQLQGADITLAKPINVGGATVRLDGGRFVSQVASGPITATNLALISTGPIDLSPAPNLVSGTFAAQTSGAVAPVRFNDGAPLTIGSVASDGVAPGAVGITTDSGDVDLVESGGALTVAAPINTGGTGVIRLQSATAVTQGASGPLTAAGLSVAAGGNVTLNQPTNSIGAFAASLTGSGSDLYLATSGGFTVGAISGDGVVPPRSGISAAGNITLTPSSGILTISQDVSAAILTLWPQAGGVHQTGGTITAAALLQPAGALLSIYVGSIFTAAGGVQLTGSDFSLTGPINLNAGPLTMSDTGTATISGPISGFGGLVMIGPGMLILAAANTYTGTTTVTAGTLVVAAAGALPAVQNVVNNGGLQINANSSPGAITGTGSLSVNSALLAVPSFSQGALAIQGLGILKLQAASPTTSTASSLSIDTGSRLDTTTNSFRINYAAGADPIPSIRSYLSSGYAGGTWSGTGIVTSAGDSTHALGFGDSADGVVPGLAANTILIRFTRVGDVNLDGVVGFADLITVARNYGKTGRNWDQGDVNYDGAVGFDDLLAVARNYGAAAALEQVTAMSLPAHVLPFGRRKRR